MIPLISREMVEKHGWLTDKEMLDILQLPNARREFAVIATFVGYKVTGTEHFGNHFVVFPAFVIISIISFVCSRI